MIDQSRFFIKVFFFTVPAECDGSVISKGKNREKPINDRTKNRSTIERSSICHLHGPNCVSAPTSNPDPLFSSGIFSSRRPREKMPDQQREKNISSNRRKFVGPKPSSARSSFSASRADRVLFASFVYHERSRTQLTHSRTNNTYQSKWPPCPLSPPSSTRPPWSPPARPPTPTP